MQVQNNKYNRITSISYIAHCSELLVYYYRYLILHVSCIHVGHLTGSISLCTVVITVPIVWTYSTYIIVNVLSNCIMGQSYFYELHTSPSHIGYLCTIYVHVSQFQLWSFRCD